MVARAIVWIIVVVSIMYFASMTSAYLVRQAEGNWLYFDVPRIFFVSTGVIIFSSILLLFKLFVKGDALKHRRLIDMVVGICGVLFIYLQFQGWAELVDAGVFFAGRESNPSGSFFYVLTASHMVHVAVGVILLLSTSAVGFLKGVESFGYKAISSVSAIFWHFVDILWVYLLFFILFIR